MLLWLRRYIVIIFEGNLFMYYNCFVYPVTIYRDEAVMEYLKIAQDLEMYGVNYFEIKVVTNNNKSLKFSRDKEFVIFSLGLSTIVFIDL